MIKDNTQLIRALVDAFLLLESSGPAEVNPDTAVRGMEGMAADLLAMNPADQQALRMQLEQIAEQAKDHAYSKFVRALPDMIGLAGQA